jgi:hypothetical protein
MGLLRKYLREQARKRNPFGGAPGREMRRKRNAQLKVDQWERLFIGKTPNKECAAMRAQAFKAWEEIERSAGVQPGESRAFIRKMREAWIRQDTKVPALVFDTLQTIEEIRRYEAIVHQSNEEKRTRGTSIYRSTKVFGD